MVAVLSSGWALWLMRDRPALALALGLLCVAVLVIGLRRRPFATVGFMQVDDLGRVFWRPGRVDQAFHDAPSTAAAGIKGTLMLPAQWHRAERSVWIRLEPDHSQATSSASGTPLDLRISASDASAEEWAALQRWLLWLERGKP
ncbi:MAG: hypothetical protein KGR68_13375 [Betaproteobacteria bacterium]|nr:hypothetical protein [Betaproteobacteria bacterium]